MADFEKSFTNKYNSKQKNDINKSDTYKFIVSILISICCIIYFTSSIVSDDSVSSSIVIDNYDNQNNSWDEPSINLMSGGEKYQQAFNLVEKCIRLYHDGSNMRVFERWNQSKDICGKVIYYMRKGGL